MINGKGGSGKSELARYLVDNYGFVEVAFSDGIYNIAENYFDMKTKDRKLLQDIGQKMREINPMVWVDSTFNRADKYDKVVISDVRQENEYIEGIEKGYLPIRINADLDVRVKRITDRDGETPDLELLENESETGADNFEFVEIFNNGEIELLYKQIDELLIRVSSKNNLLFD